MDGLSRSEYPAMLAHLQPGMACHVLQERVKRMGKINVEIADWLQERRKVEEQYVAGLKKLTAFKVPNAASELGIFQPSWESILRSVDTIANTHHLFGQRIEKDVETPLRSFQNKKEMSNMNTIAANLHAVAKDLEDAQEKSDKLTKKGGKANAQKVDAATLRLENASQQWESQAPFVFETFQALDEQRVNHLRDTLTQLETHEVDQASQNQATAETLLNLILEIKTEDEIAGFVQRVTAGRPRVERRGGLSTRQSSIAGASLRPSSSAQQHQQHQQQQSQSSDFAQASQQQALPPLAPAQQSSVANDEDTSEPSSLRADPPPESKLRSRIGTMLGRRRQSIHGGFGPLSQSRTGTFGGRISNSSHGRTLSPRASSTNLAADANHQRLSSLAESPISPMPPSTADTRVKSSHENTSSHGPNGTSSGTNGVTAGGPAASLAALNGLSADDIFGVPPPPGPPPSHQASAAATGSQATKTLSEPRKDADGFTIPALPNDPISQAQREAMATLGSGSGTPGDEAEPAFKVSIQNEPVAEEDAAAKQAALSNVANTLNLSMPSRKAGTIRGRRDVRNTIYVPTLPTPEAPSPKLAQSPTFPSLSSSGRAPPGGPVAALSSEASIAGTSDTQSIRSANSLGGFVHQKHPDMAGPGLNASIIETVSAHFEDGEIKAAKISGEIAFSYNATADSPAREVETIRVNNIQLLEAIGPNRIFVQNTSIPENFTLNTTHLQPNRATAGFTFRAFSETTTSLAAHCPLAIRPVWKPTGDKLGLLLQYRLNPAAKLPRPVVLRNLVLIATYEGARASGAQTKPTGTHVKDKHLVYWRVGDVTLTDAYVKIVCRIIGQQGAEPQPGHVEARWEYAVPSAGTEDESDEAGLRLAGMGISISQLHPVDEGKGKGKASEDEAYAEADPFADASSTASPKVDGGNWTDVSTVRQIVSGRYEAK